MLLPPAGLVVLQVHLLGHHLLRQHLLILRPLGLLFDILLVHAGEHGVPRIYRSSAPEWSLAGVVPQLLGLNQFDFLFAVLSEGTSEDLASKGCRLINTAKLLAL